MTLRPRLLSLLSVVLVSACTTAPVSYAPPGALNLQVTQVMIHQTICIAGWTATVRPSTSYTNAVKLKLIRERGLPDSDVTKYELDHFVPLALGGHPSSVENLWLQLWEGEQGAKKKDQVEATLHRMVCRGQISLDQARLEIAADWSKAFDRYVLRTHHLDPVE